MSPAANPRPTRAPHANTCLTSVALAVAALFPLAAQGQAAAPAAAASAPAAAASADATQTIYVTANRRREPAREVPMRVDRLSAEELDKGGAKTLSDYLGDQVGVDVKTTGGAGMGAVSIRGVSTGDQTIPTVGTYIDDVAYGSSSAFAAGSETALDMALLDLNHIEVLRGPQGTLYGAGAMGGVIKYVTNEPDTTELSGKVSLGASTTRGGGAGNTVSGVANVPIKQDVAALRLSAFRDHDGGWVDVHGGAAGKDLNRGDTTGGRVALLVEPSARFHVRATALTQDIRRDNADFTDITPSTGQPVDGWNERTQVLREPHSMRTSMGAVDLEYDFGGARLNSITSVQRSKLGLRYDLTAVYAPLITQFFGFTPDTVSEDIAANVHKTTQEFRLTSAAGGTVEWLAGLYWDRETGDQKQHVLDTAAGGSPAPDLAQLDLVSKYDEIAAYGDITWNATSDLALTGGVRVAQNKQDFTQIASGPLVGGSLPPAHSKETPKTWLATARYALSKTSNVYVRAASGYRPGGPNAVLSDPATGEPLAPPTFQHDSLWSYEAGYKGDLFDNTLSLESAVYDIRWKGIQQVYSVNGIGVIVNAGRAEIQGFELGATWRPTARWSVVGHLSTIDARLKEDAPGLGLSGQRLPNSAQFAASLGAKASFEVAGHAGYFGLSERYAGERNAGFDGSGTAPNYRMPAYWLTDVQGGVDFGRISLALYARNVFDTHAQLGTSTSEMALGGPAQVEVARPRTLGLALTASF
ncbi:MAG: TonB-dependent receptor [Burkholderiales bacterium]|nr:TonB-dependent receptor [Burkholderiales bacterium]